jgi:MYXO-CTERM domain-containing protein
MRALLIAMTMMVLVPAAALAGESCTTDADCADGALCLPVPCGCACPACEEGQECPPCECPGCDGQFECAELVGPEPWQGDECETDGDCPTAFSCQEVQVGCASSPTCPPCGCPGCNPDEEDCANMPPCECEPCEEPDPVECEDSETIKVCVYEPAECTDDGDCDEGFKCEALEECWGMDCACAECVCAECPEGEECPCDCPEDPLPCDCPEEPTEECKVVASICVPDEIPCSAADDCPAGWECAEFGGDCACPECACAPCAEGEECPECNCGPCDCSSSESVKACLPEGWAEEGFSADYEASGGAAAPMEAQAVGNGKSNEEEPPAATDGNGNENTSESSGCSASSAAGTPAPILILLAAVLGLGLVVRRRQRSLLTR